MSKTVAQTHPLPQKEAIEAQRLPLIAALNRRGNSYCTLAATAAFLALLCLLTPTALSQGCAQCRDNTAQTPPRTQAAYRHAIVLLAGSATLLFGATIVLLKRQR